MRIHSTSRCISHTNLSSNYTSDANGVKKSVLELVISLLGHIYWLHAKYILISTNCYVEVCVSVTCYYKSRASHTHSFLITQYKPNIAVSSDASDSITSGATVKAIQLSNNTPTTMSQDDKDPSSWTMERQGIHDN